MTTNVTLDPITATTAEVYRSRARRLPPPGVDPPHDSRRPSSEAESIAAAVVGSGAILIQACAVIPTLMPGLLVVLVLTLPLIVLGAAALLLVAFPIGIWRLVAPAGRRQKRRSAA